MSTTSVCAQATTGEPYKAAFQVQAYHREDAYQDKLRYRLATPGEMGLYKCRDDAARCNDDVTVSPRTLHPQPSTLSPQPPQHPNPKP